MRSISFLYAIATLLCYFTAFATCSPTGSTTTLAAMTTTMTPNATMTSSSSKNTARASQFSVSTQENQALQRVLRGYFQEHQDSFTTKINDRCRHNDDCPFCWFYTACCANMERYGLHTNRMFDTHDARSDRNYAGSCICGKSAIYDAGGYCWGDKE